MNNKPDRHTLFSKSLKRKAARKLSAQKNRDRPVWFGFGMFGLVGWAVTVPTLLGVILGVWIDNKWDGSQSWTLNFLIIGVLMGCINAWYWISKESEHD